MKKHHSILAACFLAATAALASTSAAAAASSGTGGSMYIESCSLGCSSGAGDAPVFCAITGIHVNEEIHVRFSEPVDFLSVNAATFQVFDVMTGVTPPAEILADPIDPNVLIYRTSLTFDAMGNPMFGFGANNTYQIKIPGEAQGDAPPFIRSVGGADNQSRLQCSVTTNLGVLSLLSNYCSTSPNSVGPGAAIGFSGSSSLTANDLVLTVAGAPASERGLFFFGAQPARVPLGDGLRCVAGPFVRLYPTVRSDGSGAAARVVDLSVPPVVGSVAVGSTAYFQFLYRDTASTGSGFNLSDGLEVLFYP